MKTQTLTFTILFVLSIPAYSKDSLNDLDTILKEYEGKSGIKEIEFLIKKGINEPLKNNTVIDGITFYRGATPLMIASAFDYEDIAEYLIENKANVNAKTRVSEDEIFEYIQTPLTYAVTYNNIKIIKLLLKNNADVINKNLGATPLMIACAKGENEIVELLIKYGANVNIATIENFYPIMAAALNGHYSTAEILIGAGADLSVKDLYRCTVLDYADMGGDIDTINLIKTLLFYK